MAWAITPSSFLAARTSRAQISMCQPSPSGSAKTTGSRQVSLLYCRSGPSVGDGWVASVLYQRESTSKDG